MKKYLIITIIIFFVIISYATAYFFVLSADPKAKTLPPLHTVAYNSPIELKGRQEPASTTVISYEQAKGTIHDWQVSQHAEVKEGTVLYEYYNPRIEQQITRKRQNLNTLKQEKKQSPEYKQMLFNLQNEISDLQSTLRTPIKAPMSGKVYIIDPHPTKDGQPLLRIYTAHHIIKMKINEKDFPLIQKDQQLKIIAPNHTQFMSKVTQINTFPLNYHQNDEVSQYEIELTTQKNFAIGTHFRIKVPNPTIEIPKSALYKNQFVFVKKKDGFAQRYIKYKKSEKGNTIIIIDGLKPSEIIAKDTKYMA